MVELIETETSIYMLTERVSPLSWHIKRKSLSGETIRWGLSTVAATLKFINGDASSVHGSVRVGSVFVSESGEWKLGGFEVLSPMNDDHALIYNYALLVPDANRYAPPEVAAKGWSEIKKNPLTAVDAFGLGCLVFEAFNGSFMGTDQLTQARSVPSSIAPSYKRLINANPKLRLSAGHFLDQGKKARGFFQTPLIHITESADNLGLMTYEERDAFLEELDKVSDDFPEDFFKMKILPELLKSVEFGGGGPNVFAAIMKIGTKLSDDEFESRLGPVIMRLFQSPDRALRVCLLDNLPQMIDRIPQKDVNGKMWPAMTSGFTDTAPIVREQTVKGVLTIITKLSDRTINGELLRFLAKTANDDQPGIRTNTTICLGKIARSLGIGSRAKVLIAAFTRSLRDPFVHARNAALMALNATIDIFSDDDCANKLLPALCMSLVDKEKPVRDQANKTFDTYLQRVRKHASSMPDSARPPEETGTTTGAPAARMGGQSDTSWAGWAISSFTNKLTTAKGEMQIANGAPPQTQSLLTSGRNTPSLRVSSPQPASSRAPPSRPQPPSILEPEPDDTEDVEDSADVWGTMDVEDAANAWGTMDDDEDAFFDAPAATKPLLPTPAVAFDDGGEPDFAGWLAAQNKAKPKAGIKGLNKPTTNGATLAPRPVAAPRIQSAGAAGVSAGAKTAAKAATRTLGQPVVKKEVVKPKQSDLVEDDDWGSAWD